MGGYYQYSRDLQDLNFAVSRIRCKGTEKMLSECSQSRSTNECNYVSDIAAVECKSKHLLFYVVKLSLESAGNRS